MTTCFHCTIESGSNICTERAEFKSANLNLNFMLNPNLNQRKKINGEKKKEISLT